MKVKSKLLNDIEPVSTAHGVGLKQVFLSSNDNNSKLTQFAYGTLLPGEGCKKHKHPTMVEYFFFLSGKGEYWLDGKIIKLNQNVFLRIPVNTTHKLTNTGNINLEFIYFGVAIDEK